MIPYAGQKFGDLKVIQKVNPATTGAINLRNRVRVECSCGTRLTIPIYYMTKKVSPKTHCGCKRKTIKTTSNDIYRIWLMMLKRTTDERHHAYKNYGGRGIRVCDAWSDRVNGFRNFLNYIGPRPSKAHTIDRVDNDLGYQPFQADGTTRQVRWATPKEQRANQRPRTQS